MTTTVGTAASETVAGDGSPTPEMSATTSSMAGEAAIGSPATPIGLSINALSLQP
jgi:hypothetical protein